MGESVLTKEEWNQDWRNRGQESYLFQTILHRAAYHAPSETWTHDHCEFCWATFSERGGEDLREGYTTSDSDYWICDECFDSLRDLFQWSTDAE